MKIYNILLDAAQPVRKVLAVPANTQKFGVVVKAENIDSSNLLCSMVDGGETIEGTRIEDGIFLFEMSSIGQESNREVKIVLETPDVTSIHDVAIDARVGVAADGEIEVQNPDIVVDSVTIDGETYPVEWKVIMIDGEPVVVLAAKVETPESSDSDLDSTNTEVDGLVG